MSSLTFSNTLSPFAIVNTLFLFPSEWIFMEQGQPKYSFVENQQDLDKLAVQLEKEPAIGVDLEADSMYHYREKVCLLQVSSPTSNILVDTLAVRDLSALENIFADNRIRKIFHGADYDIRSLHRDFKLSVNSLFDTQIAARFLGLKEAGLADLLRARLGVTIKKKYQKEDWSQRPLPEAMLTYAVMDSLYLIPLARMLEGELKQKGRLSWAEEECRIQSQVRSANNQETPLFLKFKGAGKYDARSLAVLEAILKFREKVAEKRDRPPFKVLGNPAIMALVEEKPVTLKALRTIKGIGDRQKKALGGPLIQNIQKALSLSGDGLPAYPKNKRRSFDPNISRRVKALKTWRQKCAQAWTMEPGFICNNVLIQAIADGNPKDPEDLQKIEAMRNWQMKAFGQEICSFLVNMGKTG
ncbi:MAG: HRDC domain-containing protein [Deltaproteobacteria bacterium]|nr:HRDC domain-containing protein [Deltaproteobacteria bacterium]